MIKNVWNPIIIMSSVIENNSILCSVNLTEKNHELLLPILNFNNMLTLGYVITRMSTSG